jgi:hypothetical protein
MLAFTMAAGVDISAGYFKPAKNRRGDTLTESDIARIQAAEEKRAHKKAKRLTHDQP